MMDRIRLMAVEEERDEARLQLAECREACGKLAAERDDAVARWREEQKGGDQDWFRMKRERDEARDVARRLLWMDEVPDHDRWIKSYAWLKEGSDGEG